MLVEMGELLINPICCFPGLCPSPSLIRANPGCVPRAGEEMRWWGDRWPSPPWRHNPQTPFLADTPPVSLPVPCLTPLPSVISHFAISPQPSPTFPCTVTQRSPIFL